KAAVEVPPYSIRAARSKPLSILTSARVRRLLDRGEVGRRISGANQRMFQGGHPSRRRATRSVPVPATLPSCRGAQELISGNERFSVTACSLTGAPRPPGLRWSLAG